MKPLLVTTAIVEIGSGLAYLGAPSRTAWLVLGAPLDAPAASIVARIGGAGLLTLGVACWLARNEAAGSLIRALVLYNVAAAVVLAYAGIALALHGMLLWPSVILHAILAAWCIASALGKSS